jgi:hypothetical protein
MSISILIKGKVILHHTNYTVVSLLLYYFSTLLEPSTVACVAGPQFYGGPATQATSTANNAPFFALIRYVIRWIICQTDYSSVSIKFTPYNLYTKNLFYSF